MQIGTIVKSNSHISYLCRVYGKLETDSVPEPENFSFGTFVQMRPVENSSVQLVGVIRDTVLLNPDFGHIGPRLSNSGELAVFSPDYLNETGILVDILVLGWREGGKVRHTIPAVAAQIGTRVETMDDETVVAFHRGSDDRFVMGYMPQLMMRNDPMIASLLLAVLDRLEPEFPDQRRVIGVLKNNLAWKARVIPAG